MKKLLALIGILALVTSCDWIKETTKEKVNQGGEVVGKTATEFLEGVSEGVDRTLECEIKLSEDLKARGLKTGKFSIEDSANGNNNRLQLYLIFDQNFDSTLLVKAFDKKGLEIGRVKLPVSGEAGDAGYYDFIFDARTDIEVRSKITIE